MSVLPFFRARSKAVWPQRCGIWWKRACLRMREGDSIVYFLGSHRIRKSNLRVSGNISNIESCKKKSEVLNENQRALPSKHEHIQPICSTFPALEETRYNMDVQHTALLEAQFVSKELAGATRTLAPAPNLLTSEAMAVILLGIHIGFLLHQELGNGEVVIASCIHQCCHTSGRRLRGSGHSRPRQCGESGRKETAEHRREDREKGFRTGGWLRYTWSRNPANSHQVSSKHIISTHFDYRRLGNTSQ